MYCYLVLQHYIELDLASLIVFQIICSEGQIFYAIANLVKLQIDCGNLLGIELNVVYNFFLGSFNVFTMCTASRCIWSGFTKGFDLAFQIGDFSLEVLHHYEHSLELFVFGHF